jgi:plastocyanin
MRAWGLVAALSLVLLGAASPAGAAEDPPDHVVATAAIRYLPPTITITAGDTLALVNLESALHDVVAVDRGADGEPLFRSAVVGAGGVTPVARVEVLQPSVYSFYCSVHDTMTGLLTVEPAS